MNVRPLHDRIIVQRLEESEQRAGAIIIPDSVKEKPQQGKVLAAGLEWNSEDAHSAAYDAERTAELFCAVCNQFRPLYESAVRRLQDATDDDPPNPMLEPLRECWEPPLRAAKGYQLKLYRSGSQPAAHSAG